MCEKLPHENLNSISFPSRLTITYICEVTIAQKVCGRDQIF